MVINGWAGLVVGEIITIPNACCNIPNFTYNLWSILHGSAFHRKQGILTSYHIQQYSVTRHDIIVGKVLSPVLRTYAPSIILRRIFGAFIIHSILLAIIFYIYEYQINADTGIFQVAGEL